MLPAVTGEIKARLPFVMLCTDEWMHWNLLTNDYTCCLVLFPPPLLPPRQTFFPIRSHVNSQFKESLLDGQFVPKSIGNSHKKILTLHVWWRPASLRPQTLLLRMLARVNRRSVEVKETVVGGKGDRGLTPSTRCPNLP